MPRLVRIVTCYRQWDNFERWLGHDALFAPDIAWLTVNDDPRDPPPTTTARRLTQRGVQIVTSPDNLGRSGARNLGTAHAHSAWVEHIDGDDLPLPVQPTSWPAATECDLLQFPTVVAPFNPASSSTERTGSPQPHQPIWTPLTSEIGPIDVRLSATVWSRTFLEKISGYDPRFDGFEDVHLGFKAARAGARIVHFDSPKQVYCQKAGRATLAPIRVNGSLAFMRWLRTHHPEVASREVSAWLGKELLYQAVLSPLALIRNLRPVWDYLRWRVLK